MRAREPSSKGDGPEPTELAVGVPPPREIHLAEAGDDEPELQETIEIHRAQPPRLALRETTTRDHTRIRFSEP